jgi:hypothetical protein
MEPTTPDEDFFMFQLDRWQCDVCGQLNDDDVTVCIPCATTRAEP